MVLKQSKLDRNIFICFDSTSLCTSQQSFCDAFLERKGILDANENESFNPDIKLVAK